MTGPGGTGKTRLALEVARTVGADGRSYVVFVDLAPIAEPASVLPAIASTLGVKESAARSLHDELMLALRDSQLLLVLDNFEQVVAAATVVAEMLTTCPRLTVLATSRVPLHVGGERLYPVPPLALPDEAAETSVDRLVRFEAIAMFVQRAQAVKPDFRVTDDNARFVAEICVRLAGLPLAIELAAARISVLSPRAILQRFDQPLQFLTGGARDLPDRQRTLRDTIRWSYDLLEPHQQALLRQLSVFSGGWTLEAAEAVVDLGSHSNLSVLDVLIALADSSLLRSVAGIDDEPRFWMLDTIHEFALEQLEASADAENMKNRHADYFLHLAEVFDSYDTSDDVVWSDVLEREHDNMRAAITWLRDTHDIARGLRLVGALGGFWFARGYFSEGRAQIRAFLDLPDDQSSNAIRAARARALTRIAWATGGQGDYLESLRACEEALAILQNLNDQQLIPETLIMLGIAAAMLGDVERARSAWLECVERARTVNDKLNEARALNNLGDLVRRDDQIDAARDLFQASLAVAEEAGSPSTMALALTNLGSLASEGGNFVEGQRRIERALRLYESVGISWGISACFNALASLALKQCQLARATRLRAAAGAILRSIGSAGDPFWMDQDERELAELRSKLGDEFQTHWEQGSAMTVEEAVAEALHGG
jgi:predicted ATPase